MKNYTHVFFALLLAVLFSPAKGIAQVPALSDCTLAREQFAQINDHLLLSRDETAEEDPKAMKAGTQVLEAYIKRIMLARLADSGDPRVIQSYLGCMQEREETRPAEWSSNTPQVFITKTPRSSIAVSSMLIMRGGDAISYTRPVVQCFYRSNRKWTLIGGGGEEFDAHSFFIHPLNSPNPEESWYLLSGTAIGGTGGLLHLEVVSCSASKYRKVWDRDDFIWGEVKVNPDRVVVTYEKQEDPQIAKANGDKLGPGMIIMDDSDDPDPKLFSETLRVTSNGLEQ